MKRFTMNLTIAAAALLVAAGTASAQGLKAEIPFAFAANGQQMQPGTYRLSAHTGTAGATIFLDNLDTRRSVVILGHVNQDAWNNRDPEAKLVFECVGSRCALERIWTGEAGRRYDLYIKHPSDTGLASIRVVSIRLQ